MSAVVIFFALVFPGVSLSWWGNNVNDGTVDSKGTPWKVLSANKRLVREHGHELRYGRHDIPMNVPG